jgi:hypothetical protein
LPGWGPIGRFAIGELSSNQPRLNLPATNPVRLAKVSPAPVQANNPNIFTNPIPTLNLDGRTSARVKAAFTPAQPYLANLYTATVLLTPFNQLDWSKPIRTRLATPITPDALNINLFTNPIPFYNVESTRPTLRRSLPAVDVAYNQNLYSIVVTSAPFAQTDWAKPFRVPSAPFRPDQALNINIFTNPYPFYNADSSRPVPIRRQALAESNYNSALYTIAIVAAPFNQTEWLRSRPIAPLTLSESPLNINLFTNPIPFLNSDISGVLSRVAGRNPDAPYNQNLYTAILAATPIFPIDIPRAVAIRGKAPQGPTFNLNLAQVPFFPIGTARTVRINPASLGLDSTYNVNLYSAAVTSAPFYAYETFPQRRFVASTLPDVPYNLNLYTTITPIIPTPTPKYYGAGGGGAMIGAAFIMPDQPVRRRTSKGGSIEIKSEAQRLMLERAASDPVEAARRGITVEQAKMSLERAGPHRLPHRLGALRPNRHGPNKPGRR